MNATTEFPTGGGTEVVAALYSRTSSAVSDGVHKHTPCPLMTTTGMQRKPGVQVRLAAGSPKVSRHSHLNPGFKVVFARIDMVEEAFFCALPIAVRTPAHGFGKARKTHGTRAQVRVFH
jgi:hypothetical protein